MPDITRRDFLNGVAVGAVAAGVASIPGLGLAETIAQPGTYPPKLSGMRGGEAFYKAAHALAWNGKKSPLLTEPDGGEYDMIIVGGGLSGLGAALHYQKRNDFKKKVLIIDNHDDFGGHAQRNEFTVDGVDLIASGGSDSIVWFEKYHENAKKILDYIPFDYDELEKSFDWDFYKEHNLDNAMYLNKETFGEAKVLPHFLDFEDKKERDVVIDQLPVSAKTKQALKDIAEGKKSSIWSDLYGLVSGDLGKISYLDFLKKTYDLPEEGAELFRGTMKAANGLGMDIVPAAFASFLGMRGFGGIVGLYQEKGGPDALLAHALRAHFIDGNSSVARMFVRALRPDAVTPGKDMASIIKAKVEYAALDREGANTRIRLKNTVLNVRHAKDNSSVDVTYADREGNMQMARAKHCILACWHQVIPHICPELAKDQKDAQNLQEKAAVAFVNVAIKNWKPIKKSGVCRVMAPGNFFEYVNLERPIRLGGYNIPEDPSKPAVISMLAYPTPRAEKGQTARDVLKAGRHILYGTSFEEIESHVKTSLEGIWGDHGFKADELIAGITVNRWGHGYSYLYNSMFDDHEPFGEEGPHNTASKQHNRISIANCDARAHADVGESLREAYRSVEEQIKLASS